MIVKERDLRVLIPESNLKEVSRKTGISYGKLRARASAPETLTVAELLKINKAYPIGAAERMERMVRG